MEPRKRTAAKAALQHEHLTELDALVGEHVMGESPEVFWEDSYAHLRFESLQEALEAMRDPYYQLFIPEVERAGAVVAEVRSFAPYSASLEAALEVVGRVSAEGEALRLRQENGMWFAAFGARSEVSAPSAAEAICHAALCSRNAGQKAGATRREGK